MQTKEVQYKPLIRPEDEPAIDRNKDIMDAYRPALRTFYFDSTKYETYLEQLGIEYPTLWREGECIVGTP